MHLHHGELEGMEQKITIKIAGRTYVLKAATPENEELIRLAAEDVNKKLNAFMRSFPGKSSEDILSFVALNECVSRLAFQKKMEADAAAIDRLVADTGSYLAGTGKK